MASVPVFLLLGWSLWLWPTLAGAQVISLDTPVPPLQWINLTPLLQGPAPPPLRDSALGYDETSRSLVVFGGESEGGFVQSRTYLLNLDTLTWSTPLPPANLGVTPPARSAALSGLDFAASNRHAFLVLGGKGSNDVALSDAWAFDFTNQFWSQVTISNRGPEARWGASGGNDPRIEPVQDQLLPGPNNTFYLAGGMDSSRTFPQSDLWRLNISGILSANLPSDVLGSWQMIPLEDSLPGASQQGSTILGERIVSAGGCVSTVHSGDPSCAQESTSIIDIPGRTSISPSPCAAPRIDPVLVPNMNDFSSRFASQVFLVLGNLNTSLWDDGGGLGNGEVDILDLNTGSWSRVLPAGDPGSSGQVSYPTPREGAAVFSFNRGLVGSVRERKADTIVFGGRDGSGRYLSEVWLLRSYADALTSSSGDWSGYGDGTLLSGINADGSGVRLQYIDHCVTARNTTQPPADGQDDEEPVPTPPLRPAKYNTSFTHKLLSSLSIGLLLLSSLLLRVFPPFFQHSLLVGVRSACILSLTVGAYGVGVGGFIMAFTASRHPLSDTLIPQQQHSVALPHLSTPHGIASLVLFVLLYGLAPAFLLLSLSPPRPIPYIRRRHLSHDTASDASETLHHREMSPSLAEKPDHLQQSTGPSPSPSVLYYSHVTPPLHSATWGSYPPVAYNSNNNSAAPRRSVEALSTDDGKESASVSGVSATYKRGFEVLNRPNRAKRQSGSWPTRAGDPPSVTPPIASTSRSLSEIDWLQRRRSLNAVGELDYALSVAHNTQRNGFQTPDPHATRTVSQIRLLRSTERPGLLNMGIWALIQVGLFGLTVVTLIALWNYAPRAAFCVCLVWALVVYTCLVFIPQRFSIEDYILSKLVNPRMPPPLRDVHTPPPPNPSNPSESVHASTIPSGPYLRPPPFLRTVPVDTADARQVGGDEEDEDLDEDDRQRMIEEEMNRREVSIVTVPKRKLLVANPS